MFSKTLHDEKTIRKYATDIGLHTNIQPRFLKINKKQKLYIHWNYFDV